MGSVATAVQLPKTNWIVRYITLADNPPQPEDYPEGLKEVPKAFTFPRLVAADPLTYHRGAGSEPKGTSWWWPWFQVRHKTQPNTWVQGHMVNENLGGRGEPSNLLPLTCKVNSNMCWKVEDLAKQMVDSLYVFRYEVRAFWDLEPSAVRRKYGVKTSKAGGLLYWGEQFAPTRITMKVEVYPDWLRNPTKRLLVEPTLDGEVTFYNKLPV